MIKKTIMITSIAMIFLIGFTTNNANAAEEVVIEGAIVLGGTDVFFWEFTGTDGTSDLEVKLECGNSGDPSTALDPFLTVIDPSGNARTDDDSSVGPCDTFFEGSKLEYATGEVEDGCWTTILEGAFGGTSGPYTLKVELQGPGTFVQGCVTDDVEAEKTWTKTDYNWDPICTLVDPITLDCLATRPANINNNGEVGDPNFPADDDVLADTLPIIADKHQVQAHANKNKFQNTNPGAFYALTTVDVISDLPAGSDALKVWELYADCTNPDGDIATTTDGMLKFVSKKDTRNVKVAIADPDGNVTELTDDLYDGIGGSIVANINSAHVDLNGPIPAGSTVYVLVKFNDNLKGAAAPGNVFMDMCLNSERVMTANTDITVEAALRVTTTPLP